MADYPTNWWQGALTEQMDPTVGGGAGLLEGSSAEIIKAIMNTHNSVSKLNDAVAGGGSVEQAPPGQAISQATAAAPSRWDAFAKALDTPQGAGGFASMIGKLGAAIAAPNSWQARLGTTAGQIGSNTVAGVANQALIDRLIPPTNVPAPFAPNSSPQAAGTVPTAVPNDVGTPNFREALRPVFSDLLVK
jgi:hypothetical protein